MKKLINKILSLKNSWIKNQIDTRLQELQIVENGTEEDLFCELCFCILTANYTSEGGIRIQKEIGNGFIQLEESELAAKLKKLGHRFPNARAKYIVKAREHFGKLKTSLNLKQSKKTAKQVREFFAENIYGLGYKEASHFLRNIGIFDVAILDFHIIDILVEYAVIERPKTLTKKKYLEIEQKLGELATKVDLSHGELDFYLWYMETGKILK